MRTNKYKKGYTLIEISIVLIVLAIVFNTFIGSGKALYQKSKYETTKVDVQEIKKSLIGYALSNGKLPLKQVSGDLPYVTLQTSSQDIYGKTFYYDVLASLETSTSVNNMCTLLSGVNNTTDFPQVVNDSNVSIYALAAIVISKGEDKTLSGENAGTSRLYESANNKYNNESNDDIIAELTVLELYGSICP